MALGVRCEPCRCDCVRYWFDCWRIELNCLTGTLSSLSAVSQEMLPAHYDTIWGTSGGIALWSETWQLDPGAQETVACTFQGVGDTVTKVAHGFAVDDPVIFHTVGASGLTARIVYYVVSLGATPANEFLVSTTIGGAAFDIAADSSGSYYPPLSTGDTRITHDASTQEQCWVSDLTSVCPTRYFIYARNTGVLATEAAPAASSAPTVGNTEKELFASICDEFEWCVDVWVDGIDASDCSDDGIAALSEVIGGITYPINCLPKSVDRGYGVSGFTGIAWNGTSYVVDPHAGDWDYLAPYDWYTYEDGEITTTPTDVPSEPDACYWYRRVLGKRRCCDHDAAVCSTTAAADQAFVALTLPPPPATLPNGLPCPNRTWWAELRAHVDCLTGTWTKDYVGSLVKAVEADIDNPNEWLYDSRENGADPDYYGCEVHVVYWIDTGVSACDESPSDTYGVPDGDYPSFPDATATAAFCEANNKFLIYIFNAGRDCSGGAPGVWTRWVDEFYCADDANYADYTFNTWINTSGDNWSYYVDMTQDCCAEWPAAPAYPGDGPTCP